MSAVSDELPPNYQRVYLEVQYPTCLVEKSEELKAILHSGDKSTYFIRIVDANEDSFKGCFVRGLQVTKTQKSLEEDTLKVDHDHDSEQILLRYTTEPYGTGATTTFPTTANTTVNSESSDAVAVALDEIEDEISRSSAVVTPANEDTAAPLNQLVNACTSPQLPPANFNVVNNVAIESSVSSNSKQSDDSTYPTSESGVSEKQCESEEGQRNASLEVVFGHEEKQRRGHALYHFLHKGDKCPFYKDIDLCRQNYDDGSAWVFKHYMNGWKFCDKGCEECIVDHLASNVCNSSCPLWKFCLTNKIYSGLKHASKGFVIHSKLWENKVGKICPDYADYQEKEVIGHGGFGKVYRLNEEYAVKEEYKRPLIFLNSGVFQLVTQFNNTIDDHVIPLLEYVVGGPSSEDPKKRVFLFVMPLMNRGGLNEHFKVYKSILEYMTNFSDQKECIFSNYIMLFLHVFKGLQYLHNRKIVHGDIKDTNILVHQTCSCDSPLRCVCPGGCGVTYVIGDMDLFCVQGESLSSKYLTWAKEKFTEPAGTRGLKATELYFMGMQGEKCASNKTDIWASSLTMMKILAGDDAIKTAIKYLNKFFDSISLHSSDHVFNIAEARKIADQLQKNVPLLDLSKERPCDIEYLNKITMDICDKFKRMSQLLGSGKFLKQGRWMFSYTYPEKLPLPLIIGTVHGANVLYEECLNKIPSVFGTPLWETMNKVLNIITACVRFLPDDRPDASQVITDLEKLQNK